MLIGIDRMQSPPGLESARPGQGCPVLLHCFLPLFLRVLYSVQAVQQVSLLLSYSVVLCLTSEACGLKFSHQTLN